MRFSFSTISYIEQYSGYKDRWIPVIGFFHCIPHFVASSAELVWHTVQLGRELADGVYTTAFMVVGAACDTINHPFSKERGLPDQLEEEWILLPELEKIEEDVKTE